MQSLPEPDQQGLFATGYNGPGQFQLIIFIVTQLHDDDDHDDEDHDAARYWIGHQYHQYHCYCVSLWLSMTMTI